MARTKISEFSAIAADNTDIDLINIAEGCAPSGINNAIRELMAQLKDFQTGAAGDPFNGAVNGTVGATTPAAGTFTNLAYTGTLTGGTGVINIGSGQVYKDASGNVGIGTSSPARKLDVAGTARFSGVVDFGGGIVNTSGSGSYKAFNLGAASGAYNVLYTGTTSLNVNNATDTATLLELTNGGNLGLGVTPSAWGSGQKALEFGAQGAVYSSGGTFGLMQNAYFNGSSYIYKASAQASFYYQAGAGHYWLTAPSGTAGNAITFTQAMTLDASGNLGVGTTSPTEKLTVAGAISATSNAANFDQAKATFDYASGAGRIASYASAGSSILFFTNSSGGNVNERARIDASGNLRINNTNTSLWVGTEVLTAYGFSLFKNAGTPALVWNTDASGGLISFSAANRTDVGSITTNGTTTAYNTTSDYRLKENVAPMQNALATVAQLKPCTYTWKENGSAGQGFIAHELQAIVPDCVTGEKDAVDEDGNPKYQGVDTSFLVATLVAAIQELKAEVDALKAVA